MSVALSLTSLNSLISLNSLMTAPLRPLRTLLPLGAFMLALGTSATLTTNNSHLLTLSLAVCQCSRCLVDAEVEEGDKCHNM